VGVPRLPIFIRTNSPISSSIPYTHTSFVQNNEAPASLSKEARSLAHFAASLLGVNAEDFAEAMTCSTTVTRGEVIDHLHNKREALGACARDLVFGTGVGRPGLDTHVRLPCFFL